MRRKSTPPDFQELPLLQQLNYFNVSIRQWEFMLIVSYPSLSARVIADVLGELTEGKHTPAIFFCPNCGYLMTYFSQIGADLNADYRRIVCYHS